MSKEVINVGFIGNPNCGKTTLFNAYTGANLKVANWPGVTVEKKEGKFTYKGQEFKLIDLPGIYSLTSYTMEEKVSRECIMSNEVDVIVDVADASCLERNLYLTTQLMELGIPVVMAVNMMDVVRKNGDKINVQELSRELGCKVVEISALKGAGIMEAAEAAITAAKSGKTVPMHTFSGAVEHAIAHIEESIEGKVDAGFLRWYAIKLFERDEKVMQELRLDAGLASHIEEHIADCEKELDDDAESIITNQRYAYIAKVVSSAVKKKHSGQKLNVSDKIDRIVTNRILALPIFVVIMGLVYYISIGSVGDWTVGFMNDTLFGEWITGGLTTLFAGWNVAPWLSGLVIDGIVAGVGAVLGFVPQMLILFLLLSILEDVGYMARVAFIMDRIFRKFGLSGKSFIPMLIGSGCGVPGVMASRTIENERDRRMTIMTTCFIPCGAKMPIIGMIAGAFFNNAWWVATSAYFIGVATIIISGIILKKLKAFAGEAAPFVMELPPYHAPAASNVLRATWERGWSFIKRAGTVILLSSVILWFLQGFGFVDGSLVMVEDNNTSLLATIGSAIAFLFAPLGFGNWQAAVATFTGLIAKENVVGTLAVCFVGLENLIDTDALEMMEGAGAEVAGVIAITKVAALAYLMFNLYTPPCFAAIGAMNSEMKSAKWLWAGIGLQMGTGYTVGYLVYQIGTLVTTGSVGAGFVPGLIAVGAFVAVLVYLCLKADKDLKREYALSGANA